MRVPAVTLKGRATFACCNAFASSPQYGLQITQSCYAWDGREGMRHEERRYRGGINHREPTPSCFPTPGNRRTLDYRPIAEAAPTMASKLDIRDVKLLGSSPVSWVTLVIQKRIAVSRLPAKPPPSTWFRPPGRPHQLAAPSRHRLSVIRPGKLKSPEATLRTPTTHRSGVFPSEWT
jgi:hypothetical protein